MHYDVMKVYKYTKTHSDLSGGTNPTVALHTMAHNNEEVIGAWFDVNTPFNGTGITQFDISIGDVNSYPSNQIAAYQSALSAGRLTARGDGTQNIKYNFKIYDAGDYLYFGVNSNIIMSLLTAGRVDIYIGVIQHIY